MLKKFNNMEQKMMRKKRHHTFTVLIEQDEDGYYVATALSLRS